MTEKIEVVNAIITSARFDTDRGCLSAWLTLDYGGSVQGFGGYMLYAPASWASHKHKGNFAGHFVWRCLQIAEVDDWSKIQGRSVRARRSSGKVYEIGHIIKDDWFNPGLDFEAMASK